MVEVVLLKKSKHIFQTSLSSEKYCKNEKRDNLESWVFYYDNILIDDERRHWSVYLETQIYIKPFISAVEKKCLEIWQKKAFRPFILTENPWQVWHVQNSSLSSLFLFHPQVYIKTFRPDALYNPVYFNCSVICS